ncbi:MAG: acyl-CoA thioesterase, partial [Candidatus Saccharimonadales bacterium]
GARPTGPPVNAAKPLSTLRGDRSVNELHSSSNRVAGEVRLRVRYAETDQMGVVYYSNFLVWFEIGRVELLRQLGFDYKTMEIEDDCFIPVVEANCRYKSPARYDDELIVETRVTGVRGAVLKFRYRVTRVIDRQLLAEGETTHVVTDSKLSKRALPEKYVKALKGD